MKLISLFAYPSFDELRKKLSLEFSVSFSNEIVMDLESDLHLFMTMKWFRPGVKISLNISLENNSRQIYKL